MFVLCPHCQFLVAVDPATGQPPEHCPRCDGALAPSTATPVPAMAQDDAAVAPGDDGVVDTFEAMGPESEPGVQEAQAEPAPDAVENDTEASAGVMPGDDAAVVEDPPALATQAPESAHESAPDFAPTTPAAAPGGTRRRWPMPVAIAALAMLLALQILLADRAQLAADARWRPMLAVLCGALRCELPPWHEPTAFTLVDRDVRPDPARPGVLHVSARFRNDARWPQAWPQVLLTLSDVDGRVAGARLFSPREYGARLLTQKPIASGQVADIAMDVIEPAPDIVAFTFDFR
jgi:Protein of unknown function (DUF3426)